MYCLWPLPCVLFVSTTLVHVLFVATPMCTISLYYFGIFTLLKYVYFLWQFVHTTLPCVLLYKIVGVASCYHCYFVL